MFTGIIEKQGQINKIIQKSGNKIFWIGSPLAKKLKTDQSVCHDGVCLTIEDIKGGQYRVTAVGETLKKTTLNNWKTGQFVNLERCLKVTDRLDGHFVQGHVDTTGMCKAINDKKGSWEFSFEFSELFNQLIIEKGSITINGISLTAFDVTNKSFTVAIIPYTFEHTNLKLLKPGEPVNLEFDLIGKYINRKLSLNK